VTMKRLAGGAIAALIAGTAWGQRVTDPATLPADLRSFASGSMNAPLPCKVQPVKPLLNFSLRFQAGYLVQVPLNLYEAGKHHWDVVFRVTPQSGTRQPVYFTDSLDLSGGHPDAIAELRGMFVAGEGRYGVSWSLRDDAGRVCRKEWDVEARAGRDEHVLMPPDTAGDLFSLRTGVAKPVEYPRRVTVVVNAALPRSARMGEANAQGDASLIAGRWATLVSMVASVVERMAGASVRTVVIDLDQQRELLREESFGLDGMRRVWHATDGLQQWSVDYRVLQNPLGGWNLLVDEVKRETGAEQPADVVVFVGLPWRSTQKMPASFPAAEEAAPRFFYLQYRAGRALGLPSEGAGRAGPAGRRPPASVQPVGPMELPDGIDQGVRRMKGRTFRIYTPGDLNKAIGEIERGK
jgi:hypothetical protein